ncbi:unnamed protein product [Timema podura]|uniref:Ig-like domain-containing protein n=1 Tax=Timema podura TaxID=61482 RepID=A0ABN7P4V5_TIMPD|nr:unnamed protein product [Timema podura]
MYPHFLEGNPILEKISQSTLPKIGTPIFHPQHTRVVKTDAFVSDITDVIDEPKHSHNACFVLLVSVDGAWYGRCPTTGKHLPTIHGNARAVPSQRASLGPTICDNVIYEPNPSKHAPWERALNGKYHMLPSGELMILNISRSDAQRTYRCRTHHQLTQEAVVSGNAGRIQLTDIRGPVAPILNEKLVMISAKVDETVVVPCVAYANPRPQYR